MRISDWSSDVCSSDLGVANIEHLAPLPALLRQDMRGGIGARLVRHPVLPADKVADGAEPFFEQSSERLRRVRTGDRPVMVADEHRFNAARLEIAQQPQSSEEHTSELQSLLRISYAVFCLKNKKY